MYSQLVKKFRLKIVIKHFITLTLNHKLIQVSILHSQLVFQILKKLFLKQKNHFMLNVMYILG